MERIPYVIDNIEITLAEVLNKLLAAEQQPQFDIATAYFSIRGYELVRATLPGVQRLRLLLGDHPQDGGAAGLRPDSRAYLRNELNAESLTQTLVEELMEEVAVRRTRQFVRRIYPEETIMARRSPGWRASQETLESGFTATIAERTFS